MSQQEEDVLTERFDCKSEEISISNSANGKAISGEGDIAIIRQQQEQQQQHLPLAACNHSNNDINLIRRDGGKFCLSYHSEQSSAILRPVFPLSVRRNSSSEAERDDAIWEQFASPETRPDELNSSSSPRASDSTASVEIWRNRSNVSPPSAEIWRNRSSEKTVSAAFRHHFESPVCDFALRDSAQRQQSRHRSLDLDRIHISEPDLHRLYCRPLTDNVAVEPDFSFCPRTLQPTSPKNASDSPPAVSVSVSRAPLLPAYQKKAAFPSAVPAYHSIGGAPQEEQLCSRPTATIMSSGEAKSPAALVEARIDVPGTVTEGTANHAEREGNKEKWRSPSELSSKMSCDADANAATTKKLSSSKRLVSVKTKSRLIEATIRSSPNTSKRGIGSGELQATQQSPVRPSVRLANRNEEGEMEEDPFKDIDTDVKFKKGNRKPATVAQWAAMVVITGALVATLTVKELKGKKVGGMKLWKWWVMAMVILCGRLVSGWGIHVLVIICEKNFLFRKKVMYFVYGLRKGVQNCVWLGLVLAAWRLIFDPTVENHRILFTLTKLFECFVIAAFIWLAKILLVKCLASSFHVSTFFERIRESLFHQHVLETLSTPLHSKPAPPPAPLARIGHIQNLSPNTVSAGTISSLMSLVRAPGFGTLSAAIDQSIAGEDDDDGAVKEVEINSELQAKAAGKEIFKNVALSDSRFIVRDDLLHFLSENEVDQFMASLEGAKDTGKITKKALKNWVVKVYQERRSLAHSLNDTKTAVKELHRMASAIVIIVIIVIWLLVLGIASTHVLVFIGSQMLLVGFMFGNTMKQIFEAIIFLFVMHPYDVGDRCIIDGVQLVVEEMKILTTIFLRPDNEKVFYPNSVLAMKPISNLYRSPDMKEFLSFSVHISTPVEKIDALKERVAKYVEAKSEHWQPKFSILVNELEDLNRLKLSFSLQHTINFQNFGERMNRRSELLLELKRCFAGLEIEYRLLAQPIQLLPNGPMINSSSAYCYPPPLDPASAG